jgi:hypothetical protein
VNIRTWRFISLLLAALAMGMHLAHALELAPKLQWDAELYLPVQTSLYEWFGKIGPIFEVGALVLVSILTYRLRARRPAFQFTLVSAVSIVLALLVWVLFVLPANSQIMRIDPGSIPADWSTWRDQWQFGQAGIFILHIIGFSSLIQSVLVETDADTG